MRKSIKLTIYIMRAMVFIGVVLFMAMMAAFDIAWNLERILLDIDSEGAFIVKMVLAISLAVIGSVICIRGTVEMTKMEE